MLLVHLYLNSIGLKFPHRYHSNKLSTLKCILIDWNPFVCHRILVMACNISEIQSKVFCERFLQYQVLWWCFWRWDSWSIWNFKTRYFEELSEETIDQQDYHFLMKFQFYSKIGFSIEVDFHLALVIPNYKSLFLFMPLGASDRKISVPWNLCRECRLSLVFPVHWFWPLQPFPGWVLTLTYWFRTSNTTSYLQHRYLLLKLPLNLTFHSICMALNNHQIHFAPF